MVKDGEGVCSRRRDSFAGFGVINFTGLYWPIYYVGIKYKPNQTIV